MGELAEKEITYEEIKKELEDLYTKLDYLYGKSSTKSKLRRLIITISALDSICDRDCLNLNIGNKHLLDALSMKCKFFDYYDDVYDNLNFLKDLSLRVIYTYKRNNYPLYQTNKRNNYIPFDDISNLICEFYHSFNDETIDKFIDKMNDNYYYAFPSKNSYSGALYALPIFKKYIVHLNTSNSQNLYFAITNAHEMGHAYENELHCNASGAYLSDKCMDTIFSEVSSSFFEYAFINFLKDNDYYPDCIMHEYDEYYHQLLKYAFKTYAICLNGIDDMDEQYKIKLDDKSKMDKIEKLKEMLNYYRGLPNYNDKLSIMEDSIMYFVGQLLAINFYDKYKDNPKEFMRNFRTSLVNYPRSGSFDSFEVTGITREELLSGRILRKELRKFIGNK